MKRSIRTFSTLHLRKQELVIGKQDVKKQESSILELIGNTPMVQLKNLVPREDVSINVKLEY